jgi:hypothetical protein
MSDIQPQSTAPASRRVAVPHVSCGGPSAPCSCSSRHGSWINPSGRGADRSMVAAQHRRLVAALPGARWMPGAGGRGFSRLVAARRDEAERFGLDEFCRRVAERERSIAGLRRATRAPNSSRSALPSLQGSCATWPRSCRPSTSLCCRSRASGAAGPRRPQEALEHTRAVFAALREVITGAEFSDMATQLPGSTRR